MNITKAQIEAIKQSNDIVSIIKSKGINLKKKGKNYIGLCPFHSEDTPSFTVDPVKQLYHCFGCKETGKGSTGGDVIGFVVKSDNVSFQEAIKKLTNSSAPKTTKKEEKEEKKENQSTKPKSELLKPHNQKLLKRVIEFYHRTFAEDNRGLKYLTESRKITDKNIFTNFKIGYANGTLLNTIPDEGEIINTLKEIGVLNKKGNELFYGSVIFPIYNEEGNITSIYGRKIKDGENNHLYLPVERRGVFNWQSVKINKEVILTESIIDTLTLYNAGYKNSIPCYGINGLISDHLNLFKKHEVKTIYLCLNGDKPGQEAAKIITSKLSAFATVYNVTLPNNHDINSFFSLADNSSTTFKALITAANPKLTKIVKESPKEKKEKDTYQKTDQGFTVKYGDREYEVIGISKSNTKLKATIKGIKTEKSKRLFHVDTVDFYSARSRKLMISGLSDLFVEGEGIITNDLNKILEQIENLVNIAKEETNGKKETVITESEREDALKFLKNPKMFEEITEDFEIAGYTGDNTNKLLCYIACISRKLENPISVMIQSRSAAGKSFLQDTVLSFIPDEDFIKYTRLTDQSLFYKEEDSLKHRILAIEELDGMNGAVYSIRAMQSSGQITIAYTGKDALTGSMKTEENKVNGPVMMFVTTTAVDIDNETASRFMFGSLDESAAKTSLILKKQREKHTLAGLFNKLDMEKITQKHQTANRLLKSIHVINPYANFLTFSSKSIRVHREHDKYLSFIDSIAYLFQYQREKKKITHKGKEIEYIYVKISDIEKAHKIANEVLGNSLNELSTPSRRLLQLIKKMVNEISEQKQTTPKEYHFTRREIREYTGWSDFQIRTHIKELEEMEYLHSVAGKHGKEYVYELNYEGGGEDGSNFLIGLIPIEELKVQAKKEGLPVD